MENKCGKRPRFPIKLRCFSFLVNLNDASLIHPFNPTKQNIIGLRSHEPHHHTTLCSLCHQSFFFLFFFFLSLLDEFNEVVVVKKNVAFWIGERETVVYAFKPITPSVSNTPSFSLYLSLSYSFSIFIIVIFLLHDYAYFFQNPIIHSVKCPTMHLM